MRPVDWFIVLLIALAVLGGLKQGFLRSAMGLGGTIAGLSLAAWNYSNAAGVFLPMVHVEALANAMGFLIIVLVVMGLARVSGSVLSLTAESVGLGFADRLAGGLLGFLEGFILVTILVWVSVAFYPHAAWLTSSRLARDFFGACRLSTHISPQELADRVLQGLNALEEETYHWIQ
jgi:membrane protein required for colicin V production